MLLTLAKTFSAFALIALCPLFVAAQNKPAELFAEVRKNEKTIAECERTIREYQLAHFGRVLPRPSGHCFEGCPIIVPKPYYSPLAKRLNISGQIKVETIVNETGDVIYARVMKGLPLLNRYAVVAAYRARHTRKLDCNGKPIKFRWAITYNFR